jgi:2,3-bisphosphoglycerate-dependent phosphoglycerate mutase
MRLLLVRHASSSGQEPDAHLSGDGMVQAQGLAGELAKLGVDELYASPYRRAVDTVTPFALAAGLRINIVEDLRERKLANGWRPDFLVHMERSFQDPAYRLEGGESLNQTSERGLSALAWIAREARGDRPAAASHGNLIASVLRTIDPEFGFAAWKTMRNPDMFDVTMRDGKPVAFDRIA